MSDDKEIRNDEDQEVADELTGQLLAAAADTERWDSFLKRFERVRAAVGAAEAGNDERDIEPDSEQEEGVLYDGGLYQSSRFSAAVAADAERQGEDAELPGASEDYVFRDREIDRYGYL